MFQFPKSAHLCGERNIAALFAAGESFVAFPFRVVFLLKTAGKDNPELVRVLISVAKKRHKRANARNRIKRLIRESYRLNCLDLKTSLQMQNRQMLVAFQYISDEIFDFHFTQNKMKNVLKRLQIKVE